METNKPKNTSEATPTIDRNWQTPVIEIAGTILSLAAGIGAAWYSAQRNFNNRVLKQMPFMGELERKRYSEFKKLPKDLKGDAFVEATKTIFGNYHGEKEKILAEKEIGLWRKWKMLDKHGKGETILTFTAVSAVGLSSLASLVGISKLNHKERILEERLDKDKEAQLNR